MQNPFTLNFGKEPLTIINRQTAKNQIVEDFTAPIINNQVYIISGVRGSGKTVLLTEISKQLAQQSKWLTVELNSTRDLMTALLSKLYDLPAIAPLLIEANIDLSFFGIGVHLKTAAPIVDIETALSRVMDLLQHKGYRLLVTIDEVTNSQSMREFTAAFQILVRQEAPIFLLMTGLYENISDLQNEDSLTFLYRAPKVFLSGLNLTAIMGKYQSIFKLDEAQAMKMAKITQGYPFAFQLLGYLKWQQPAITDEELLTEFDIQIQEYVYQKLWHDLSPKDQSVLIALAKLANQQGQVKISTLRQELDMSSSLMSIYRDRLKKKGLVDASRYGYLSFTLPRFDHYIKLYYLSH